MQALLAIWARVGLTTRLIFASGLATCLALVVATFLSANLASQQAKKQLDTDLQERLADLSGAISAAPARRNIEALLNQKVMLPGISAAGYRSAQDATALEKQAPEIQTAPEWFLRLCALTERQGVQPVIVDGHLIGQAALTMSPIPAINAAWDFLIQQFYILIAGASIVFVGVWLALRANLKPFNALVESSRVLGRGDFSQRMTISGSREFRDTFTAFNSMADNLESLVGKLTSSEHAFSALVEAAPAGVLSLDREGNLIFANSTIRQISGISEGGVTADVWLSRVHPDDQEKVRDYWAQIWTQISQGDTPDSFVHRYLWLDGRVVWVQVRVASLRDREGTPENMVVIVNDITAERELRQRSDRLSRLYATLSRVNSIIVQAPDDKTLYAEVCRAIVDIGRFEHATITLVDWERRKLRQALSFGVMPSSSEFLERDLDDPKLQSVGNLALLEGRSVTANDFVNDDRFSLHVRESAKRSNACSASAVPIRRAGLVVGNVSIASSEAGYFTQDILELIDEIGRDVSFALDNIDRTEQKRLADAAVVRSEQNLSVTLRSIGDAVLVTDAEGRVTMLNPVAEALTGWADADACGQPVGKVFHIVNQDTRAIVESPVDIVLRDGNVVGLANHTVLIARDGTERPIADSGAPIRYAADGDVSGVVLVFRDQTDEYRVLKALRDSERLYSSLAENVPVGIYLVDLKGDIRYLNSYFLKMVGSDEARLSIKRIGTVVHPDDLERLTHQWGEACKSNETTDLGTFRCTPRDGVEVWVHGLLTPIVNDQGQTTLFVGVMKDITAERDQLQRIERLSRFNATLSQVNAAITHCVTELELFERICKLAAERSAFVGATVYMIDVDVNCARCLASVVPYGDDEKAKSVSISLGEEAPWTLIKEAIRSGSIEISADLGTDQRLNAFWRGLAEEHGLKGACVVPFRRFNAVVGAMTLFVQGEDCRDQEVLALIEEIGRDVSHALENMDRERQRRQAEEVLKQNEEQLRLAVSSAKLGTFVLDFVKMESRLDATCARYHNLGDNPVVMTLEAFLATLPEEVKVNAARQVEAIVRGEQDSYSLIASLPLPDGSFRWLHNFGAVTAERTADGGLVVMYGVTLDITASKSLEDRDRLAATVFDHSSEAIIMGNAKREVILVNEAFTRITGFSESEALNKPISTLYRSDRHDKAFYDDILDIVRREGVWQGEIWRKRKNGEVYPALTALSVVRSKNGEVTHFVEQQTDISKQKEFEARISELAYRDALTGLPNRTLLRDRVEQNIALAHREGSTLALLFLDLDHFKNINDSLGHSVGDQLLSEIAQRLTSTVRDMDTVGRLGGDEFLILLPDANAEAAAHVAQKLLTESARPLVFKSHSLVVTPSVGIALYPKDGSTFDELLTTADTAMYRAKDEGRNAYRFYTPEMNQTVFQRMVLESSLRRAIEQNEFVLHYQPKFELQTQTLVGVEALIRWHQPEMGMISPAQFIPVAEESGLIEAIGKWVLEEACRQVKAWQDEGLPLLRVAVNFSARQFAARNITELVTSTLEKIGVSGNGLEMEITESLLAQDMDYTLKVFKSLKKLGVHVAVDDFGTGYSSLSYLKRFPIDRLKIDQSFVRDLVNDSDDRAIATAIVTLGHSLGIRVIAEGVETVSQLDILREMGCDEVQGYYLGRPIPAAEMTIALRKVCG